MSRLLFQSSHDLHQLKKSIAPSPGKYNIASALSFHVIQYNNGCSWRASFPSRKSGVFCCHFFGEGSGGKTVSGAGLCRCDEAAGETGKANLCPIVSGNGGKRNCRSRRCSPKPCPKQHPAWLKTARKIFLIKFHLMRLFFAFFVSVNKKDKFSSFISTLTIE